jgi:hypothetical protein
MNVSASKILLAVTLACCWDQLGISGGKAAAVAKFGPAPAGAAGASKKELTAGMVNRTVTLNLAKDPFESVPLERGSIAASVLVGQPGQELPEMNLQGVFVSFGQRVAVVNNKTLREGQVAELENGSHVRAKRIGLDYVVVEGAGQLVMLRLDEMKKEAPKPGPGGATAAARGRGSQQQQQQNNSQSTAQVRRSEPGDRLDNPTKDMVDLAQKLLKAHGVASISDGETR